MQWIICRSLRRVSCLTSVHNGQEARQLFSSNTTGFHLYPSSRKKNKIGLTRAIWGQICSSSYSSAKESALDPTLNAYNQKLRRLVLDKKVSEAKRLYWSLVEDKTNAHSIDILTCNIMLKLFGFSKDFTSVEKVLDVVNQRQLVLHPSTFHILMDASGAAGRAEDMLRFFENLNSAGFLPNAKTYAILISRFSLLHRNEESLHWLKALVKSGLPADERTLLRIAAGISGPQNANVFMNFFRKNKERLTPSICSALIAAFSKLGLENLMNEVLQIMDEMKISSDVSVITAVMKSHLRKGEMKAVFQLFEENRTKYQFTRSAYNVLLWACHEIKDVDRLLRIFNEMPDKLPEDYAVVLLTLGQLDGIQRMLQFLEDMLLKNVRPNTAVLGKIVQIFGQRDDLSSQLDFLRKAKRMKLSIASWTLTDVLSTAIRTEGLEKAVNLLFSWRQRGFNVLEIHYGYLIDNCRTHDRSDLVDVLLSDMKQHNYKFGLVLDKTVRAYTSCGDLRKVQTLFQDMIQAATPFKNKTVFSFVSNLRNQDIPKREDAMELLVDLKQRTDPACCIPQEEIDSKTELIFRRFLDLWKELQ
eukprot:TRINITY_DN7787_c0_g1_i1.p1 TRINITY_DN7787_c0_g1~~TRINITY_DN7787_c0_g1_i1.p1  ORF type:complete len:586 (-),score=97.34 TRINITY_DN7787_c0_g1_i1:15-1772(-)